ncbi:hypothetical protein VOLCADRAFT_99661 [Volvox carteri f. nagariensis]|uniref:Uncharacterized protein n=1 Tax=Volvox carteri f. nagariensis TaxID=3068 RepID=D8UIB0_VOLCA|nr:uncharacterized protein VOLCADRAFT_99661 [Volvox carteri f. nagariensis]EFJ40557.1 hypothetical protein VOLCADRAFT_99661 [Volvox carteri f. nagariensis]|eukprot:XP_002958407.1 hypothetical protein VOLCADRAFT_99661 [Volvox carteri f. nagariensis]
MYRWYDDRWPVVNLLQKRQKLDKLAELGFAEDMAEVLVETLGLDPIGKSTDAAIAEAMAGEGLVDLASVIVVAGEVDDNAPLSDVNARTAVKSLRILAPNLGAAKALQLAKAACALTAQPSDESDEGLSPLLDPLEQERKTNEEMAKALVGCHIAAMPVASDDSESMAISLPSPVISSLAEPCAVPTADGPAMAMSACSWGAVVLGHSAAAVARAAAAASMCSASVLSSNQQWLSLRVKDWNCIQAESHSSNGLGEPAEVASPAVCQQV